VVFDTGGGIDNVGTVGCCGMIAEGAGAGGATDFFLNVFFKKLVNFFKRPCLGGCSIRISGIGILSRAEGRGGGGLLGCNSFSIERMRCL
jgi:hypothetical protein